MCMKAFFYIFKSSEILVRLTYGLVGIALIAGSMYILGGHAYLSGTWGTDTRSIIGMLLWINKFFPNVPFWYPLAGGGISLTHSYPVFSLYIISFIKRVSELNLIQTFTLVGFSSILAFAASIYVFVSIRFKNQTAALIASIFYLISPIAWTWLTDWGFYAESIAHAFVVPAILFWDLFFVLFVKKDWGLRTRIFLLITVVLTTMAMRNHFLAGFALIRFYSFYVIGFTLLNKGQRKQILIRGTIALLIIAVFSYLAALTFTVPFQRYENTASQAGVSGSVGNYTIEDYNRSLPGLLNVGGFATYKKDDFLWAIRGFSFTPLVSIFALIGIVLSIRDKRKLTFAIYSILAVLSLSGHYLLLRARIPYPFNILVISGTGWRETFMIMRFVWPTLAAFGIIGLVSLPLFWVKNRFVAVVKCLVVATLSLLIAFGILYLDKSREIDFGPPIYRYGAQGLDTRNIWQARDSDNNFGNFDVCVEIALNSHLEGDDKIWCNSSLAEYFPPLAVQNWCLEAPKRESIFTNELPGLCYPDNLSRGDVVQFLAGCDSPNYKFINLCRLKFGSVIEQLSIDNWPAFKLPTGYNPNPELKNLLNKIMNLNANARIDFSPYLSNYSMVAPIYTIDTNLSQIHTYVASASLIHRFQGWQQIVYYLNDPQYDDHNLVNNIAKWFGINYVFTVSNQYTDNEVPIFERAGWKVLEGYYNDGILEFPQANSLAELSNRKTALVISQKKVDAYDQVLTISLLGVLNYDDAFIVWGKDSIDDYSFEDFKKFDLVILQGYSYRNKKSANSILNQYVESGGSVFIDTGWESVVPDWQNDHPLDIIPLQKTEWKSLSMSSFFYNGDNKFTSDVDITKFAPLIYQNSAWKVSTSALTELKPWARSEVIYEDYPLVVYGQIGQGKVVWSGMNLFAHAKQKDKVNRDEIKLLTNIFSWLLQTDGKKIYEISYTRRDPDNLDFVVNEKVDNGGYLLWKEGYHPDMKAQLISKNKSEVKNLNIYRAGPGWALIEVPDMEQGDLIHYSYNKPFIETFASLVSTSTYIFLILAVLDWFMGKHSIIGRLSAFGINKARLMYLKMKGKTTSWIGKDSEDEY